MVRPVHHPARAVPQRERQLEEKCRVLTASTLPELERLGHTIVSGRERRGAEKKKSEKKKRMERSAHLVSSAICSSKDKSPPNVRF
jgi:hypothetical protein